MSRKPSTPKAKPAAPKKVRETKEQIQERDKMRWRVFALEYIKNEFNATKAAIAAGYSPKTARAQGSRLLTNVDVQKLLTEANRRIVEKAELDGAVVVRKFEAMFMADTRSVMEVHVGCCRYCYGIAHKYQFTWGELTAKQEAWLDEGKPIEKFDEKGGGGYNASQPPKAECPECLGQGLPRLVVKDTRNLSAAEASLIAGYKVTDSGRVIPQLNSLMDAGEKLLKIKGMYEKDNKQRGGLLGSLPPVMRVEFVDPPPRANDPLKDKKPEGKA